MAWVAPQQNEPMPLLVGLHTWSAGYDSSANGAVYACWAIQRGWHFVHPHFRGPNHTPESMGSDLAVQDILDAVRELQRTADVDERRIYLIGSSGGGHMALLLAGRHPGVWGGVSAWVPIADIATWHSQHARKPGSCYADRIESALGGPPDQGRRLAEAAHRSPVTWLAHAKDVPLDINHGVHDGRRGSVPFSHSLIAFNAIASPQERFLDRDIEEYYRTQGRPQTWAGPEADSLYGDNPVLFRKVSGNARVTIFDGAHEILYTPALNWLAQQRRGERVRWEIANPESIKSTDTSSGL